MSRKSILLGVLAVLGVAIGLAPASADQRAPVDTKDVPNIGRVATFNVCNPAPCPQTGRATFIADEIAKIHPEVIALQEICVAETDDVVERLASYYGMTYDVQHGSVVESYWRCGGTVQDPGDFGNALLTASTFTSSGNMPYDEGGTEPRGYAWGETRINGLPVRVYATHLAQADQAEVRRQQVEQLVLDASSHEHSILLGDFNARPRDPELTELWLRWADADPDCETTPDSVACQKTQESGSKFDYIWLHRNNYGASPPDVVTVNNWSDHHLVYADLPQPAA